MAYFLHLDSTSWRVHYIPKQRCPLGTKHTVHELEGRGRQQEGEMFQNQHIGYFQQFKGEWILESAQSQMGSDFVIQPKGNPMVVCFKDTEWLVDELLNLLGISQWTSVFKGVFKLKS